MDNLLEDRGIDLKGKYHMTYWMIHVKEATMKEFDPKALQDLNNRHKSNALRSLVPLEFESKIRNKDSLKPFDAIFTIKTMLRDLKRELGVNFKLTGWVWLALNIVIKRVFLSAKDTKDTAVLQQLVVYLKQVKQELAPIPELPANALQFRIYYLHLKRKAYPEKAIQYYNKIEPILDK